jgi:hypothetical protein
MSKHLNELLTLCNKAQLSITDTAKWLGIQRKTVYSWYAKNSGEEDGKISVHMWPLQAWACSQLREALKTKALPLHEPSQGAHRHVALKKLLGEFRAIY